jgi:hypothetical protein
MEVHLAVRIAIIITTSAIFSVLILSEINLAKEEILTEIRKLKEDKTKL